MLRLFFSFFARDGGALQTGVLLNATAAIGKNSPRRTRKIPRAWLAGSFFKRRFVAKAIRR
jgi:hypothetical protein